MKKITKILLFLTLFLLTLSFESHATFSELSIIPFKIDPSARSIALGHASSPLTDVDSIFSNPGSLTYSKGISINFKDSTNISAAQAYPTGNDVTFSLALDTNKQSNIKSTTSETQGTILLLGCGAKLSSIPFIPKTNLADNLSAGLSLKFLLGESLTQTGRQDDFASGYDMDLGLLYKVNSWTSISITGHNIMPYKALGGGVIHWRDSKTDESIPSYQNLGASMKIIGDLRSPIYIEGKELNLVFELENAKSSITPKIGAEYSMLNTFVFRSGFSQDGLGLGAGYKTQGWEINLSLGKDPISKTNEFVANAMYFPEKWFFLPNPFISLIPQEDFSTYKDKIIISGKTKPGVIVRINNIPVPLSKDLFFNFPINLVPGANIVSIESIYEYEKIKKEVVITRKILPQNPFANINIYDNYITENPEITITGRLVSDANGLSINGGKEVLGKDLSFSKTIPLKLGENYVDISVDFDGQPLNKRMLIYRRAPVIVGPKNIAPIKPIPKVKEVKKAKQPAKKIKSIAFAKLKGFKTVQSLIKRKTNMLVTSKADIRITGYFAVYVISDFQYIALRDLKNGMIALDYYETKRKTWHTISKVSYAELLLFKTSSNGKETDIFID